VYKRQLLNLWQIPYQDNPSIVRGLDYYCHTTFEWVTIDGAGQQSSLGGGGRYDGLVTALGGPATGAVGAGIGLERVLLEQERQGITLATAIPWETQVVLGDHQNLGPAAAQVEQLFESGESVTMFWGKRKVDDQRIAAKKRGMRVAGE
jgi:histidyl-tRNA synthetase